MEQNEELSTYASDSRKVPNVEDARTVLKEITAEMIPRGDDLATVRERQMLIRQFYQWWATLNKDKKVFNKSLGEDIFVSYNSKQETSRRAAYRYESTLAVLSLDYILANAVPILTSPADHSTRAQRKYERMILMKCDCPFVGIVKLIVGVVRNNRQKEQYCITVIDVEFGKAFKRSDKHKRKTNRR